MSHKVKSTVASVNVVIVASSAPVAAQLRERLARLRERWEPVGDRLRQRIAQLSFEKAQKVGFGCLSVCMIVCWYVFAYIYTFTCNVSVIHEHVYVYVHVHTSMFALPVSLEYSVGSCFVPVRYIAWNVHVCIHVESLICMYTSVLSLYPGDP